MTTFTHLDWQPVILLKVVRLPFSDLGGLSLKCAYLTHDSGRILCADWTLDAAERAEPLVFATGWTFTSMPMLPFRLQGDGAKRVPAGTWVLPYKDSLYSLYSSASAVLARLLLQIDQMRTGKIKNPQLNTLRALCRFFNIPLRYFETRTAEECYAIIANRTDKPEVKALNEIALRASSLPPRAQQDILTVIRWVQAAEKQRKEGGELPPLPNLEVEDDDSDGS